MNIPEMVAWVVGILGVVGCAGWGLFLLYRDKNKPDHTTRRVRAATDDAVVAEQQLRASRAHAEAEVVEIKKNMLLDAVKNGEEENMTKHLRELSKGY